MGNGPEAARTIINSLVDRLDALEQTLESLMEEPMEESERKNVMRALRAIIFRPTTTKEQCQRIIDFARKEVSPDASNTQTSEGMET